MRPERLLQPRRGLGLQRVELAAARRPRVGDRLVEGLVERGERLLGVGDDADRRPRDAGDLDGIEIDADDFDVAIEAPARLRLVEARADRQHDVGPRPQIVPGEQVLREIMPVADNALAAGIGDDRRLQLFGERRYLGAGGGAAAADIDHRLLCLAEQRRGLVDQLGVGRRRRRRHLDRRQRDLALQGHDVERHLQRDRARPAVAELAERFVDQLAGLARMIDPRRPFRQAAEDRQLVRDLVQEAEAAADQGGRDLARDAQHRRVGRVGGGERGGGVEEARARHDGVGARLAARPRVAERHVGGGLLVARMDDADLVAGVVERDEQRVVLHPGQREQRVDPVPASASRPAPRRPSFAPSSASGF